MPVLPTPHAPTHVQGSVAATSLATPSRGATDTAVWRVSIEPGAAPVPHRLTREEVFVVLRGNASVTFDGAPEEAGPGDAIVVPAGPLFTLSNASTEPLELLCCLPVGGQAQIDDGDPFTPPWAV